MEEMETSVCKRGRKQPARQDHVQPTNLQIQRHHIFATLMQKGTKAQREEDKDEEGIQAKDEAEEEVVAMEDKEAEEGDKKY